MDPHPARRIAQLRAGVAGLALLRLYPDGPLDHVGEAMDRLRSILESDSGDLADPLREMDPAGGYREWSAGYDSPNPVTVMEDPVLGPLLEAAAVGTAADVACGTGRHAVRLAALGHRVLAVDSSPEMLAVLRAKAAGIDARQGRLENLPIASGELDLLVCSLALTHVAELGPVFAEFARVLRPGGRAFLSDIHPLVCATGGQAYYRTADGRRRFVRNLVHLHSEYVTAATDFGLEVRGCWEPLLDEAIRHLLSPGRELPPDLALMAFGGLPGLLLWELCKGGA